MTSSIIHLADEQATLEFAQHFAAQLSGGFVIYLHGQLGSGKTTLVRGILRALGISGAVKSPTYTLVEPYQLSGFEVFHFDLYRLSDPEELELMGIREYFSPDSIAFIEWPECGQGCLPAPDLEFFIQVSNGARDLQWRAHNDQSNAVMASTTGDTR